MAAISWLDPISGDWSNGPSWSGGVSPVGGDDVTIDVPGYYIITVTQTESVDSIVLNNMGAWLDLESDLALGGTLTVTAGNVVLDGTITGGTIVDSGPGISFFGGVLDGVTYNGTLDVSALSESLDVVGNGLTVKGENGASSGTILLGSTGNLTFFNNQTIDNATIDLTNSSSILERWYPTNHDFNSDYPVTTLTLGQNLTINQSGNNSLVGGIYHGDIINLGTIEALGGSFKITPGSFVNQGTLAISGSDQVTIDTFIASDIADYVIIRPSNVVNSGAISVSGGSTLTVTEPLDNTGTITVTDGSTLTLAAVAGAVDHISIDNSSTLDLVGDFSLAELEALNTAASASVNLTGTLDLGEGGLFASNGTMARLPRASRSPITLTTGTDALIGEIIGGYTVRLEGTSATAAGPAIDIIDATINNNTTVLVGDTSAIAHFGHIGLIGYMENHGVIEAEGTSSKLAIDIANVTDAHGAFVRQGVLNNSGAITALAGSIIDITSDAGSKLINSGTITSSGMMFINELVTGTGKMVVDAVGSLELGGAVSTGQAVTQNTGGVLTIDDIADFFATIQQTAAGGRIYLGSGQPQPDSFTYTNGRLDLYEGTTRIGALHFFRPTGTTMDQGSFQLTQATATTEAYFQVTPHHA